MKINNKKGFLLAEETLKIILAIIAILFLTYLLFSIYQNNKDEKDLKLAKASLDHLIQEMNAEEIEVEIYNPKGWWIISWPYKGKKPLSCSNLGWENCLCIVKLGTLDKLTFSYSLENYIKNIDKGNGICQKISKKTIVSAINDKQSPIEIKDLPLKLNIKYQDKNIITKA